VFTGIVKEQGRVVEPAPRLRVEAPETAGGVAIGDSVSISGVCLTVVEIDGERLAFDVHDETLARTALARAAPGTPVNVEPALRAGDPLGGHYVQGHVDGVGRIRSVEPEGDGVRMWFDAPSELGRYCVEKGSVAVSGISLTVAELDDDGFAVALIPHTLEVTTLGALGPGDEVNLEVDVLAKYVERLVARS
jgi:riboflavin synthase